MSQLVEDTLFEMLSQVQKGESISPNDVAKRLCTVGDTSRWQRELTKVRAVAVGLARQGRIDILRKGKPVEPEGFKGIYRLRLAEAGAIEGTGQEAPPSNPERS